MLSAYNDSYASYFSLQIFFSLSLYLWLFFSFTLFHELGLLIQCQIKMVIMNIFVFFLHLRRKNVQYFRVKSDVTRRLFCKYSLSNWRSFFLFLVCWNTFYKSCCCFINTFYTTKKINGFLPFLCHWGELHYFSNVKPNVILK